jgi:hypothetical protein
VVRWHAQTGSSAHIRRWTPSARSSRSPSTPGKSMTLTTPPRRSPTQYARRCGVAKCLARIGRGFSVWVKTRYDDGVSGIERIQTTWRGDRESGRGRHFPRFLRTDSEAIPLPLVLVPEYVTGNRQIERDDLGDGQRNNVMDTTHHVGEPGPTRDDGPSIITGSLDLSAARRHQFALLTYAHDIPRGRSPGLKPNGPGRTDGPDGRVARLTRAPCCAGSPQTGQGAGDLHRHRCRLARLVVQAGRNCHRGNPVVPQAHSLPDR